MAGASEVMAAGLKRAAEVKTPSVCIAAGRREACGKIRHGFPRLARGAAVASVRAAAAVRCDLSVAWASRAGGFLAALMSVVELFPFGTIGLDQINHRL